VTTFVSLDSPSCGVPCLILHSVVYRDVTRQAKRLYRLKHAGARKSGLTYLSRYNSGWFCHCFPRLLWESLQSFHYTEPFQYDAVEYLEEGVHRAQVRMTIPQHPFRSQWQPIEINMMGYRIVDTIEGAALEAIYHFCNQHPKEVAGKPIGLFSTTSPDEPEWNLRIVPEGHRLDGPPEEALQGMMRFMNVQYHYQLLLRREIDRVIYVARSHYGEADR
jgi:hypothetical protein